MTESQHWDAVHSTKGTDVSWWQSADELWIDLVDGLGLVQGALQEMGYDSTHASLHPFAEPDGCRLRV